MARRVRCDVGKTYDRINCAVRLGVDESDIAPGVPPVMNMNENTQLDESLNLHSKERVDVNWNVLVRQAPDGAKSHRSLRGLAVM